MKFIVLALAVISALGAAGDVTSADFGTAVYVNGSTLALGTCTSTVTLVTVSPAAILAHVWDFVWSASSTATASGDMGFYCNPVSAAAAPFFATAIPCVISTFTAALTRTGGSSLVTSIPSVSTATSVIFTIVQTGSTFFPLFWNSTLNAGKTMKVW